MMAALDAVAQAHGHIVAQVIEPEFGVGAVGDVTFVGEAAIHQTQVSLVLVRRLALEIDNEGLLAVLGGSGHLQHPDRKPQHMEDRRHPARVTPCQVIVDRDQVDSPVQQRVEIHGQGADERLSLAGPHLGDGAAVQGDTADQLDIIMSLADHPLGCFAHRRIRFRQDFLERILLELELLAFIQPFRIPHRGSDALPKFIGLCAQRLIAQGFELSLERVDLAGETAVLFNGFFVGVAPKNLYKVFQHDMNLLRQKIILLPGLIPYGSFRRKCPER